MKIKTSELKGVALDWAVGKALGAKIEDHTFGIEGCPVFTDCTVLPDGRAFTSFCPSTDWSQGGPLIAENQITIDTDDYSIYWAQLPESNLWSGGETHLVSACRAIVVAKLGDEVDVPEELLP